MKLGKLFDVRGRLPRGQFWLQAILLWLVFYILSSALGELARGIVVWFVGGFVLFSLLILCVRRLHDCNYSGKWLLAVFVPVVGPVWLFWLLAIRRGMAQDNRWGPDPLLPQRDYLVVG